MKILKQILKEFWLPLTLSILWVSYNLWPSGTDEPTPITIKKVVNIFGPTFFLISWMTGQFFRVKKQTNVEESLITIEQRVNDSITILDQRTTNVIDYLTGGSSYCYLTTDAKAIQDDTAFFYVTHKGEYPLYDLQIRIVDLDLFDELLKSGPPGNSRQADTIKNVGTLNPDFVLPLAGFELNSSNKRGFNIFFTARNGTFTQLYRYYKYNNEWLSATKLTVKNKVIFETVDESYPKDELIKDW